MRLTDAPAPVRREWDRRDPVYDDPLGREFDDYEPTPFLELLREGAPWLFTTDALVFAGIVLVVLALSIVGVQP